MSENDIRLVLRRTEEPDDLHVEMTYDFHATDLSYAFDALRQLTKEEKLTSSIITMQKYPTLVHSAKKTRKKDENGDPIIEEKITELKSDTRWVMSFDWKTKDPKEARCLSYDFYDSGWPCQIVFLLADNEDSPVIDDGKISNPNKKDSLVDDVTDRNEDDIIHRFELTMTIPEKKRADRIARALEKIINEEERI